MSVAVFILLQCNRNRSRRQGLFIREVTKLNTQRQIKQFEDERQFGLFFLVLLHLDLFSRLAVVLRLVLVERRKDNAMTTETKAGKQSTDKMTGEKK